MKKIKEWVALIVCGALLLGFLGWMTDLLTPNRREYGAAWGSFLAEENNTIDVMFFGSSVVYCDVAPAVYYDNCGLTAYVNAGPEQTMPITLDYIRESLRTQSPKAIFVECSGLCFKKYQDHTKGNITQMPWGLPRLDATFRAAEPELREGLLFPLTFYHDRWDILTEEDYVPDAPDPLAGFTWMGEYGEEDPEDGEEITPSAENWERNLQSLDKICALCRRKGIELVLFRAAGKRLRDADWQQVQARYADQANVQTLDCWAYTDEIGANVPEDYYDFLHYNAAGAEKFSRFLAGWTQENLNIPPDPDADAAIWRERVEYFYDRLQTPMVPKD